VSLTGCQGQRRRGVGGMMLLCSWHQQQLEATAGGSKLEATAGGSRLETANRRQQQETAQLVCCLHGTDFNLLLSNFQHYKLSQFNLQSSVITTILINNN